MAETQYYTSALDGGEPGNREKELAIAQLLNAALVPLLEIDIGLAGRCFIKGSYRIEPDAWSSKSIKAKGIAIESIV